MKTAVSLNSIFYNDVGNSARQNSYSYIVTTLDMQTARYLCVDRWVMVEISQVKVNK